MEPWRGCLQGARDMPSGPSFTGLSLRSRDSGRGAFRRASRQMLVSTGAVVINLQVYTTQANQQPAIRLLQEVVNNGSIISVRGRHQRSKWCIYSSKSFNRSRKSSCL